MLTQNYEISVWRPGANSSEVKLFTVGGSSFNSPFKAVEPQFEQKSNGEIKLSFVLYSNVIDNYTGEKLENPFVAEMQNENRVKLKLDGKWYDFVIKGVTEDSAKKSFKYEAVGLAQIELSKTGYSLNFNTELNNNIGKITDLAEQVLDGSDWQVDRVNSDTIVEKIETPLYSAKLNARVTVTRVVGLRPGDSSVAGDGEGRSWTLGAGTKVYVPYTSCNRGEDGDIEENKTFFQFFYQPGKSSLEEYPVDQDGFLEEAYLFYGDFSSNTSNICPEYEITNVRGRCVSKNPVAKYHEAVGGVVKSYVKEGDSTKYWGYTRDEYSTSEIIRNFISPSKDFEITSNWRIIGNGSVGLITVPEDLADISASLGSNDIYQCIKISELDQNSRIVNLSLNSNKIFLNKNGIAAGEKWRWKIVLDNSGSSIKSAQVYTLEYDNDNNLALGSLLFSQEGENAAKNEKTKTFSGRLIATGSCKYEQLKKKKIAMVITPSNGASSMTIKEIQLYREIPKGNTYYEIGEKPEVSIITNHYIFSKDSQAKKEEELEILYSSTEGFGEYDLEYDLSFEKTRSLAGSETNRLDLLQKLAENFKTWLFFEIEHEDDGRIKFEDGAPLKKVVFKEFIQKDNYAGFKYGINLNSIQRKIESQDICTKLIVKNNSNQYAKNGFCSIARSPENFSRENVIYNFDYYTINRNILSEEDVKEDLYGHDGLYTEMEIQNIDKLEIIDEIALLTSTTIPKLQSSLEAAIKTRDTSLEEFWDLDEKLKQITSGKGYEQIIDDGETEKWLKHSSAKNYLVQCSRFQKAADEAAEKIGTDETGLQSELKNAEERLAELQGKINTKAEAIKKLISDFDKKYAGFVQEGAWISEDYTDDTLYYLDAVAAESRSAKPKVSYTINVLDISKANDGEFGDYTFDVGEKTFIEDTEFFGYDQYGRPYQEEVVIQQLTRDLDDPSKNKITVKNYKTEFDDLFQRVASMTTKVEFNGGGYKRAADAFKEDGTLTNNILNKAMLDNQLILSNSSNNSVVWDSSGITTTNLDNANEQVRIVGGGIVLTRDGGETWSTGISGKGINAKYIVTGQLDTSLIQIINGDDAAFIWDANGLNAYAKGTAEEPINYNSYIRFNGDGLVAEEVHTSDDGTSSTETFFKLDKNGLVVNRGTIYASSMIFSDGENSQPGGPIVKTEYQLSDSATVQPTGPWSATQPTPEDDKPYTWVKTTTYYSANASYVEIYCLNGAPGANGAPGKNLVVMYLGYNSSILPSTVKKPEYVNGMLQTNGWVDSDSNITNPYIFMTQTLEGENNWTKPIRVNGIDGKDGNDYQRVYQRFKEVQESVPAPPNNEDDWKTRWTEAPQGITSTYIVEYASERYHQDGKWGDFSTPVIFSKWGEKGQDGDGVEYIFRPSSSELTWGSSLGTTYGDSIAEAMAELKDNGKGVWSDDPPAASDNNNYIYCCKGNVKINTDNNVQKQYKYIWGTPSLWTRKVTDGRKLVTIYKGNDKDEAPSRPTATASSDGTPSGWSNMDSEISSPYIFMTQALEGTTNWTAPIRINGTDSNLYERIYTRTKDKSEVPENLTNDPNTDDYKPTGWTDTPQGVTMNLQAEWASERRKIRGSSKWDNFSAPTLYSTWGEKGQDGDGVEYVFKLSNSENSSILTKPNDFTASSLSSAVQQGKLDGWSDNPPNSTTSQPYTFVCKGRVEKQSSGLYKFTWGAPALWSKRGDKGDKGDTGASGATYIPKSQTINYGKSTGDYNSVTNWYSFSGFNWNNWDPKNYKIHERITTTYESSTNSGDKTTVSYRTLSLMEAVETALSSGEVTNSVKGDGKTPITTLAAYCVDRSLTIIDGSSIATGSITAAQLAAGSITTNKLSANVLTTSGYATNSKGSKFDLASGAFDSLNLKWDKNGNLYCRNLLMSGERPNWSASGMTLTKPDSGSYLRFNNGSLEIYADRLEIGGKSPLMDFSNLPDTTNLLCYSRTFDPSVWYRDKWALDTDQNNDDIKRIYNGLTYLISPRDNVSVLEQFVPLSPGTYTFSFWANGYNNASDTLSSTMVVLKLGQKTSSITNIKNETWKQYSYTFTLNDNDLHDSIASTSNATNNGFQVDTENSKLYGVPRLEVKSGYNIKICGLKLEKGSVASAWSENPADNIIKPNLFTGSRDFSGGDWKYSKNSSGQALWTKLSSKAEIGSQKFTVYRRNTTWGHGWTNPSNFAPTQSFSVTKGNYYTLSFWAKAIQNASASSQQTCWFGVALGEGDITTQQVDSDTKYIYPKSYTIYTGGDWQRFIYIGRASSNTIEPRIVLYDIPGNATVGHLQICGLKLEEGAAITPYTATNGLDALTGDNVLQKLVDQGWQGIYSEDGDYYINATAINAGTLSANYIKGGVLASSNWNGTVDNNGVVTNTGTKGTYFDLSDGSLTSADFSLAASNIKLDNEQFKIKPSTARNWNNPLIDCSTGAFKMQSGNYGKTTESVKYTYKKIKYYYGDYLRAYGNGSTIIRTLQTSDELRLLTDSTGDYCYTAAGDKLKITATGYWVKAIVVADGVEYSGTIYKRSTSELTYESSVATEFYATGAGGKIDLNNGTLDLWCGNKHLVFNSEGLKINNNPVG